MKKKNFKNLKYNKMSISNFNRLTGGANTTYTNRCGTYDFCGTAVSLETNCEPLTIETACWTTP